MARPDISVQIYPIQGAAWKHTNEAGYARWSFKVSKRQKVREKTPDGDWADVTDDEGKAIWEDTSFFNGEDLPKVEAVSRELYRRTQIEER
jgi:hypothetical protein